MSSKITLTPETTLLTTGEAAVMLRVTRATLVRWCRRGKLASVRTPGGHRRIPLAAVQALMAEVRHD